MPAARSTDPGRLTRTAYTASSGSRSSHRPSDDGTTTPTTADRQSGDQPHVQPAHREDVREAEPLEGVAQRRVGPRAEEDPPRESVLARWQAAAEHAQQPVVPRRRGGAGRRARLGACGATRT